jgi:hypothetical protein
MGALMKFSPAVVRGLNSVMCLAFAYAAIVQNNDPDPWVWGSVYSATALICGWSVFRRIPRRVPLIFGCGCFLTVLVLLVTAGGIPESQTMSGFPQWGVLREEIIRELLGLCLVGGWMIFLAYRNESTPVQVSG